MSRLQSKSSNDQLQLLVGKIDMYHTRLGKWKYTIVFKSHVYMNGRRIALVYSGELVDNRLYGLFTGLRADEVNGKHMPLKDAPDSLIEDAIRWLI